ncbi:MAG TPA: glycosyltransferase [Verrucomicrobiae bacterium]|nr:glycosyltransferase [Verrucomicrobiae bacterium]
MPGVERIKTNVNSGKRDRPLEIVIAGLGTPGDIHPLLAIATGLKLAGHRVTFIANPVFGEQVKARGLVFTPVGSESFYTKFVNDPDSWTWPRCSEIAFREGWIPHIEPFYRGVIESAGSSRVVVISNGIPIGAQIAAEHQGWPFITVATSPVYLRSVWETPRYGPFAWYGGRLFKRAAYRVLDFYIDRLIARPVNTFRSTLGMEPVSRIYTTSMNSKECIIALWPKWYAAPQPDWPDHVLLTGFIIEDRSDFPSTDDIPKLQPAEGHPPIVMTTGSATTHAAEFIQAAAEASQILGRNFIVTTGHPTKLGRSASPNLIVQSYIPFSRLFPQAAAVVHHGGVGTIAVAIASGVRQVIIPMAFDQFDNAARASRLGVARILRRSRLNGARLAATLNSVLNSAKFADACDKFKTRIDSSSSLTQIVSRIKAIGCGTRATKPPMP